MGAKLRSAPLFYTLVQFVFNPLAQMHEYVPKVQEALRRKGFPDFSQEGQMSINIRKTDDPQPEVQSRQQFRWSFANSGRTEGYLLLPDSLVFHATSYDSFEVFLEKALAGLSLVHEIVELSYLERIGLRYLDSISPREGERVEEYIQNSLTGISSLMEGELAHAFSETAMKIDGGTLIVRSIITENGLAMAPDLVPLSLSLPERLNSLKGRNAVLDIDFFIVKRIEGVNTGVVKKQLHDSHAIIEKAFHASVTDFAISVWK